MVKKVKGPKDIEQMIVTKDDEDNEDVLAMQEQEQKPLVNQFNNWINRANELLDLSSSDSRDTSQNDSDTNNFIPQILMNPWDPQQSPMMTFAPIANAMQQYQQQWLSQYHQAIGNDEGCNYSVEKELVPEGAVAHLPKYVFGLVRRRTCPLQVR